MKFSPIKFMATLSAGGITLMAFNFLQFAIPHGEEMLKLKDINREIFSTTEYYLYLLLIVIMFSFTLLTFAFTAGLLVNLFKWFFQKDQFRDLLNNPMQNVFIFAPIASLSMTVNVLWGPLLFFIPDLNVQVLMLPSLIFFGFLSFFVMFFQLEVIKVWITKRPNMSKFTFVWLLDVFAITLVSLTGTGIASISTNQAIATVAAVVSFFLLMISFVFFIGKLTILMYFQIKSAKLPDKGVIPAFFLIIPITCLLSLSLYRVMTYLQIYFSYDVKIVSFFIIVFAYVIAISWGVFAVYLLRNYFKNDFVKSKFSPPQWGMV